MEKEMTKKCKYETIEGEKVGSNILTDLFFLSGDFKAEKSNRIIKNLVEKIEQYEQARSMETKYYKEINNQSEKRIVKAEMKSKDGVVIGVITYEPEKLVGTLGIPVGGIKAKVNFKSNNEADKTEYQGLVKLIKNM